MAELEQTLAALSETSPWPSSPDLTESVQAKLAAGYRTKYRWTVSRRRVLVVALLTIALPGTAVAAIPAARNQVLEWIGLRSVSVQRVDRLPEVPSGPLQLGEKVTLDQAVARAGFPISYPEKLGPPDGVYLLSSNPVGGRVSLVYNPTAELPKDKLTGLGLLITQFQGAGPERFIEKLVGSGTTVEAVQVGAFPGIWISGDPHLFLYEDSIGEIVEERLRLAGNALIWEENGTVFRVEGGVEQADALAIADSFVVAR